MAATFFDTGSPGSVGGFATGVLTSGTFPDTGAVGTPGAVIPAFGVLMPPVVAAMVVAIGVAGSVLSAASVLAATPEDSFVTGIVTAFAVLAPPPVGSSVTAVSVGVAGSVVSAATVVASAIEDSFVVLAFCLVLAICPVLAIAPELASASETAPPVDARRVVMAPTVDKPSSSAPVDIEAADTGSTVVVGPCADVAPMLLLLLLLLLPPLLLTGTAPVGTGVVVHVRLPQAWCCLKPCAKSHCSPLAAIATETTNVRVWVPSQGAEHSPQSEKRPTQSTGQSATLHFCMAMSPLADGQPAPPFVPLRVIIYVWVT